MPIEVTIRGGKQSNRNKIQGNNVDLANLEEANQRAESAWKCNNYSLQLSNKVMRMGKPYLA